MTIHGDQTMSTPEKRQESFSNQTEREAKEKLWREILEENDRSDALRSLLEGRTVEELRRDQKFWGTETGNPPTWDGPEIKLITP